MKRIGILGPRRDAQLERIGEEVRARGGEPRFADLTDIPAHANVHWEGNEIRFGDLGLTSLDAVYARLAVYEMPTAIPGMNAEASEPITFPVRETGSLCNSIVGELERRVPFVNRASACRYHRVKPLLYRVLQQAGVPVPEFAVGCDLAAAARFVDRLDQEVVVKPLMGGEVFHANLAYLRAHHDEFDRRPLLLQRRIRGRSYRGYVVGDDLVAYAEIEHGDVVDWRGHVTGIRPATAPPDHARAVCTAVSCTGLHFGGADVEVDDSGAAWVIDVNPWPMFAYYERQSGLDVAGPLAASLLAMGGASKEMTP